MNKNDPFIGPMAFCYSYLPSTIFDHPTTIFENDIVIGAVPRPAGDSPVEILKPFIKTEEAHSSDFAFLRSVEKRSFVVLTQQIHEPGV